MRLRRLAVTGAATLLLTACTGGNPAGTEAPASPATFPGSTGPAPATAAEPSPSPSPRPSPSPSPSPSPDLGPPRFRAAAAMSDVRLLAGRIGPRLATGPGFREAGRVVAQRFRELGYDVRRESFRVPAGDSWGVPVDAGRSFNVIAEPPGFDPARRHRVAGAHLDSVAVAPGAEDNASGVAVLLELARLAAARPTRPPTVFIAFGAEEPVGDSDALHHFGSTDYVRAMSRPEREAMTAMVSLDRVGVGSSVPVCAGPLSPPTLVNRLLTLARSEDIAAHRCTEPTTSSDHWSFEKAGFTVARLGSVPYAGYHSEGDVPRVVSPAQLRRTGRLAWAWLQD